MRERNKILVRFTCVIFAIYFAASCSTITNLTNQFNGKTTQNNPPVALFPLMQESDKPLAQECQKFAPANVGSSSFEKVYADTQYLSDGLKQAKAIGDVLFTYNTKNELHIIKFSSAEGSQSYLKKQLSDTIPTKDYDKKRKLPKCNPDKERSDEPDAPSEFIKTLPLKTGGEVTVLHTGTYWNFDCKGIDPDRDEYIIWTNGVYFFELSSPSPIGANSFGKGEAFFNDYQMAMEQLSNNK